jgi:hypothetical protein
MSNTTNPVVEIYKGKTIRIHNTIKIRVDQITLKKIIDVQDETNLSVRKILSYSSTPCEKCKLELVRVITDDGEVRIERGILSKRIPSSHGNCKNRGNEKGRKVLDTETGKIYDSIKQMCKAHKLIYPSMVDKLNGRTPNTTTFIYYEQTTELRQDDKQIVR